MIKYTIANYSIKSYKYLLEKITKTKTLTQRQLNDDMEYQEPKISLFVANANVLLIIGYF